MRVVTSGDGLEHKATFAAQPGVPTIPTTVHWKLYNLTARTLVQDWTEATFETVYNGATLQQVRTVIDVPGTLHTIENSRNRSETYRLRVRADKDTTRAYSEKLDYLVMNEDY